MKKIEEKKSKQSLEKIRIATLGGLEEVGRNMMFLEHIDKDGRKGDILIIDAGLSFPGEDMPGIDCTIPNIEYLQGNKERIKGIIITHGHYDHIGAIPYIMDKIGNPPIYTSPLAAAIIKKRQDEFAVNYQLNINIFYKNYKGKNVKLGVFEILPYHVNHNIPETIGLFIKTPLGNIMHTGDFKFDFQPVGEKPSDLSQIVKLSSKGVKLLMADSTGAEIPGHSISEKVIYDNLEKIFEEAEGRIIASTFASLLPRVQQLIWLSEKFGRYVVIDGSTMKANVEISRKLKNLSVKKGTIISPKEALRTSPKRLTIICTGSQAEDSAVLMRIANKEHKFFQVEPGDSIIFSSSVVPGNERSIQNLKDSLARQGAEIFHYKMMDIHASGHAFQEDIKLMISMVQPEYYMPIHGQFSMLKANGNIAKEMGVEEKKILLPVNGQVIEWQDGEMFLTKEYLPANYIMVDGLGVGDVGEVVLRDREMLAQDGIFVIIVVIDSQIGKVKGSPDIISRGFVYLKESQNLLKEVRSLIREIVAKTASRERTKNWAYVKSNLRDKVGEFLYKKTQRRPMVLPVVIEV